MDTAAAADAVDIPAHGSMILQDSAGGHDGEACTNASIESIKFAPSREKTGKSLYVTVPGLTDNGWWRRGVGRGSRTSASGPFCICN